MTLAPTFRAAACVGRRLLLVALVLAGAPGRAADEPAAVDLGVFLADRGIDLAGRADLVAATSWGPAQQRAAIRVLARLRAPDALWRGWRGQAGDLRPDAPPVVDDRLVALRGRAVFVAPQPLDEDERALMGRDAFDVVRIVPDAAAGADAAVDVLVPRAPQAWPRWRTIDEPAAVDGLPLSTGAAPRPAPPPADGAPWPEPRPTLVLAAASIAWRPATPLGGLGMDYALFDTVRDGGRLGAGDAAAFYALLAAVRGQRPDGTTPPTDIVPIIDPTQRWFERQRGAPVTIAGVARKATRITVDDPARRAELGADAYWELFVFVETPPLRVDGRDQESYPVVCVVREIPPGMPTGDRISERVRVQGFALKRYGYPLADVEIVSSQGDEATHGRRMETALVVGRRADWRPVPAAGPTGGWLSWLFLGIIAAVTAAVVALAWVRRREEQRARARARAALPDRIDLPPGVG